MRCITLIMNELWRESSLEIWESRLFQYLYHICKCMQISSLLCRVVTSLPSMWSRRNCVTWSGEKLFLIICISMQNYANKLIDMQICRVVMSSPSTLLRRNCVTWRGKMRYLIIRIFIKKYANNLMNMQLCRVVMSSASTW